MQIRVNKYDVVETGRWNGKFQMVLGRADQDGKFTPKFIKVKDKSIPVSLTFDTDAEAAEFIKKIAAELG